MKEQSQTINEFELWEKARKIRLDLQMRISAASMSPGEDVTLQLIHPLAIQAKTEGDLVVFVEPITGEEAVNLREEKNGNGFRVRLFVRGYRPPTPYANHETTRTYHLLDKAEYVASGSPEEPRISRLSKGAGTLERPSIASPQPFDQAYFNDLTIRLQENETSLDDISALPFYYGEWNAREFSQLAQNLPPIINS